MFEEEINLRDYLHIIRKWRWVIIAVAVVVVLFVAIKTFRQTPIYRATVRIVIEKNNADVMPFRERYLWDNWEEPEHLETQYKIIRSRMLAKQILRKLGMMEQPAQEPAETKRRSIRQRITARLKEFLKLQESPLSEAAKAAMRENQIIGGFLSMVAVTPVEDTRLVDVSVISPDREQTALIANTLAETYIEQNLETRIAASKDAVRWLVEEVENARKKLADSEVVLQDYKEQNAIIAFEDRQNIVMKKLTDLSEAVNKAKIERIAAEAEYQEVQRYKAAQLQTIHQVIVNDTIQSLKVDLSRLQSALSETEKKFRSKHPTVAALRSQVEAVQGKLETEIARITDSITRTYEIARAKERKLMKALEEQKQEALELNQKAITHGILQKEVDSNRFIYNALLQKMKETSISERLETNNIRIVDRAIIPNAPIAPNRSRNILLATMIGLVMGVTLAFFLEYLDTSLKIPEDVTRYLDIPFLGFIPKISIEGTVSNKTEYMAESIVLSNPRSIVSEAYRSLRTSVTFSALHESSATLEPGLVLLVTSSEPTEGKSCTVANLGIVMAQSGRKTLIIDCDFRKPVMHRIFNLKNEKGFADTIADVNAHGPRRGSIKRTGIPNLDVIPCGNIPSNPSELLGSRITRMAVSALREKYDTILIDSPPVNTVTDPVILSRLANGVLIVIRAGTTRKDMVQRARDQLRNADAMILGGILNNVDIKKNKYYYYYAYHYPHYYREEDRVGEITGQRKQSLGSNLRNIAGTFLTLRF